MGLGYLKMLINHSAFPVMCEDAVILSSNKIEGINQSLLCSFCGANNFVLTNCYVLETVALDKV